jgi:hypothetical protein
VGGSPGETGGRIFAADLHLDNDVEDGECRVASWVFGVGRE